MRAWAAALGILLLHAVVLWHSVQHKSASVDELSHLATGLYSLHTGDFRMNRTAPPLQNLVCALPVVLTTPVNLHFDNESWRKGIWNGSGDRLVEANPEHFHGILQRGRLGTMALSLWLGVLIFVWAKRMWGAVPALLVLTAAVFEPNLTAHGRLSTTDTAAVLGFAWTGFLLWRFLDQPSGLRLIVIGVGFGLTWYAKHSGVILLPVLGMGFVIGAYRNPRLFSWNPLFAKIQNRSVHCFVHSVSAMLMVTAVGLFVIWGGYGFEVGDSISEERTPNQSAIWNGIEVPLRTVLNVLGYEDPALLDSLDPQQPVWVFLRCYLPAFSHWEGYFANRAHLAAGHLGYFMGELSTYGWTLYYPVLFLIKTPVGLLALFVLGGWVLACRRVRVDERGWLALTLIPAVYFLVIVFFNTANIGYRHALPVLPFMLVLLVGAAFRFFVDQLESYRYGKPLHPHLTKPVSWLVSFILVVSLLGHIGGVIRQHPHYLSYFNAWIGGGRNGHAYAVDSNLDWGQDLLYIKNYIETHRISEAKLLYFGPDSLPDAYRVPYINAKKMNRFEPGTYIISATLLHGIGAGPLTPRLGVFQSREPDAFITPAVMVYTLEE